MSNDAVYSNIPFEGKEKRVDECHPLIILDVALQLTTLLGDIYKQF